MESRILKILLQHLPALVHESSVHRRYKFLHDNHNITISPGSASAILPTACPHAPCASLTRGRPIPIRCAVFACQMGTVKSSCCRSSPYIWDAKISISNIDDRLSYACISYRRSHRLLWLLRLFWLLWDLWYTWCLLYTTCCIHHPAVNYHTCDSICYSVRNLQHFLTDHLYYPLFWHCNFTIYCEALLSLYSVASLSAYELLVMHIKSATFVFVSVVAFRFCFSPS